MEQQTVDGITAYLVSLAAYGCGEVTCRSIAEHYGEATHEALLSPDWHRLTEVPGVGESKAESLHNAYTLRHGSHLTPKERRKADLDRRQRMFFGQFDIHGWTLRMILDRYGDKAQATVEADPYCLPDLDGFAFRRADDIARRLGIQSTDPRRLRAAIAYTLSDECQRDGHCYLTREQTIVRTLRNLNGDPRHADRMPRPDEPAATREALEALLPLLADEERIIIDRDAVYPPRYYWAERQVALNLRRIMHSHADRPSRKWKDDNDPPDYHDDGWEPF